MANLLKSFTNSVKHWYIPLILGILFIALGIYLFTVPLETYATLAILFSIAFLVSGIFDIFFSIKNHKVLNGWGWYLVGGIISFIMGIYLLIYPQVSIAILPFVVGFTVMFRSFQLLGTALDLRDAGVLRWGNLAVSSVLGLVLSFLLIANPLFSGISIVVLTALSFIFVGIASIILAFDLKKVKDYPGKIGDELKKKFDDLQDELEKTLK